MPAPTSRRFVFHGALLFLLGLLTGLVVPQATNQHMALSAHLEGVLNGTFLLVLGAVWHHVRLRPRGEMAAFWLILFGTYTNWATTLLSAMTGAGAKLLPIGGAGFTGPGWAEALVPIGLVSLSMAMIAGLGLVIWGASRKSPSEE
jgi:hydroxylaminobenzene mutase